MEIVLQARDLLPRRRQEDKKVFSLLKGVFILGIGMFFGFFLAYELINTSGDVLHFDDVINVGSVKTVKAEMEPRLRSLVTRGAHRPMLEPEMTSLDTTTTTTTIATTTTTLDTTGSGIPTSEPEATSLDTTTATPADEDAGLWTVAPTNGSLWELNGTAYGGFNQTNGSWIAEAANGTESVPLPTDLTTTTPLPVAPCFREEYKLRNSCEITALINYTYGDEVTLENIGHMLFKVELIDRLHEKCQDGEWCLSDDWLLVSDNNEFLNFCYVTSCLRDNIPEECLDERRRLIVSTLELMCGTVNGTANITDQCYLAVRKMAHVAWASLDKEGSELRRCTAVTNCSTSCRELARGLYCMNEICEHQKEIYEEYAYWQWYFSTDDVKCDVDNSTTCSFLMSPTESWYDSVWRNLKKINVTDMTDAKVLTVVIVAAMVMVVGLVASVLACARKGPLLKRYSRDRVEYTPVSDEDDEVFESA